MGIRLMRELRELFLGCPRILITGPSEPDGDSIGAGLALALVIERISDARVVVAGTPDARYSHLPSIERMVADDSIDGAFDVVIVVDGDRRRLSSHVHDLFEAAPHRVIIDHHVSTTPEGYTLAFIDASAASTCEMVRSILADWEVPLDPGIAGLLYTGIIFDTGGFRHSNTTAATHRLAAELLEVGIDHTDLIVRTLVERRPAALRLMGRVLDRTSFLCDGSVAIGSVPLSLRESLGAVYTDCEGIVDFLVYTRDVEVAVLMVEREPGMVKLSLRSRGLVNVALLARSMDPSGGGHPRAAGVVIRESIERVLDRIPRVVVEAVQGARDRNR